MPKPGRIPTHVEQVNVHDTIEVEHQHLFRVSEIERVVVRGAGEAPIEVLGYMLMTYGRKTQFFFPEGATVMVVDESTLTHVGWD
jgi:hypothetical protein